MLLRGVYSVLAALLFASAAQSAPYRRSTSASQQFIVYCDDSNLRQRLVASFDEIRAAVLREMGVTIGAATSVFVNITPEPADRQSKGGKHLRWIDTPEGPRVQIDILTSDDMTNVRLQEQIIEAVLLTLKYREQPPPETPAFATAPDWLVEGISEKIRIRNQQFDPAVYRQLLASGKIPPLQDFLASKPSQMDATALGIYRAYASSLLALLQDQANGRAQLLAYLEKVPANREQALKTLREDFSQLNETPDSLLKWWSLSLAKLSASDRYVSLGVEETEAALGSILELKIPGRTTTDETRLTLEQVAAAEQKKEYRPAARQTAENVARLALKANPLYRPVLAGYQEVLSSLQRGRSKGLPEELARLGRLRASIQKQMVDVSDYLNWFEATQMPGKSGEFDSYLKLVNSYDQPRRPSNEPIGKYLDALEAELK